MTMGPGWIPWIIIAPIMSAMRALVGIPMVSMGMKLVWAPALFADSGLATPRISPVPNRSGCFDIFFSMA